MKVNDIDIFKNWLWEKTVRSENCKNQPIQIGTISLFSEFLFDQYGNVNPCQFSVYSPAVSLNGLILQPFVDKKQKLTTQFMKRMNFTPFYISYAVNEACSLTAVDFYQWNQIPVIFRLFILEQFQKNVQLKICWHGDHQTLLSKDNIRIDEFYCKIDHPVAFNKEKNCLLIKNLKQIDEQVMVMAISTEYIALDISFPSAFKMLKQLEELCRHYHINRNFVINFPATEKKLGKIWASQKYMHPDHTIDYTIMNDPEKYERELTWLVDLYSYLGWSESLFGIWNCLKQNKKKNTISSRLLYLAGYLEDYLNIADQDRFAAELAKKNKGDKSGIFYQLCQNNSKNFNHLQEDDFIFAAYFVPSIENNTVVEFLQQWWNYFSLSLFSCKLNQLVTGNPEKILIILLLAIRYQLPWAPVLVQYLGQCRFDPLYRILYLLYSRFSVRNGMDNKVYLHSGFAWDNNVKRLLRGNDISYAYTRFSKKIYLTVKKNNKTILKIDHQVHLVHHSSGNEFTIFPAVTKISQKDYHLVKIKVNNNTLHLPLVFRKGEVIFYNLRLRWILKKKRFQFTLMCKDKEMQVSINDQGIHFKKSIKQKHYLPVIAKDAKIELTIFTGEGRSVHFTRAIQLRTLQIYGWALDRYGIFASHFNYRYKRKQYLHRIDPDGIIDKKISLPPAIGSMIFLIKKANRELPLAFYSSLFTERMFRFSPKEWNDHFIVLMDQELKKHLQTIQQFFGDFFAFQPQYRFKHDEIKPVQSAIILYLTLSAADIRIMEDPSVSSYPFCRIGIKKGISDLYKLYPFIIERAGGQ